MRAAAALVGLALALVACDREDDRATPAPVAVEAEPSRSDPSPPPPATAPSPSPSLGAELAREIENAKVQCRGATGIDRATDLDGDVSGEWTGEYRYDEIGRSAVSMDVTFFSTAGKLGGATSEPNTFAVGGPPDLTADVAGELLAGGRVIFMKTYDTGDVKHSVLYIGQLDDARREIAGRWRTAGVTGTFTLKRAGLRG